MTQPASLPLADLRAKVAAWRQTAHELITRADEAETHIEALLRILGNDENPTRDVSPATQTLASAETPETEAETGGRYSTGRYGIVTNKWKAVLLVLAQTSEREPFPLALAIDAVSQELGRETRPADVRRQFKPYIDAGYLVTTGLDEYQFTARGFDKIGFTPPAPSEGASAPNENAPLNDDFDHLLSGADTALHAQDRRPQE